MDLKQLSLTLATLALAAAGASQAFAQESSRGSYDENPARLVQRLTHHLDLSEGREVAVKNVLDAAKPQFNIPKPALLNAQR